MGREIRKVPPNWEHPTEEKYDPFRRVMEAVRQPMHDQTFAEAVAEWKADYAKWEAGERPDYCTDESRALEFWEWHGLPPDRDYYRPWSDAEATWFQVWETVSEGTPVTPPFATREELIDHLVANGDDWDQSRGEGGWPRANAEQFVNSGWAPSLIVQTGEGGGVFEPRDGMPVP